MARVGVLAVQGAFARHCDVLRALAHEPVLVSAPHDFQGLEGLILPGGESTVQLQLVARLGLDAPLRAFVHEGLPLLATCAGLILAARTVVDPSQYSFGFVDVCVRRNGYGRQLDSFEALDDAGELPLIFIRAPRVTALGAEVEVLARHRGEPVLLRERNVTCASFHPELGGDLRVHAQVFGAVVKAAPDATKLV
jgi:5'-phosphate synthase pdxT subunit